MFSLIDFEINVITWLSFCRDYRVYDGKKKRYSYRIIERKNNKVQIKFEPNVCTRTDARSRIERRDSSKYWVDPKNKLFATEYEIKSFIGPLNLEVKTCHGDDLFGFKLYNEEEEICIIWEIQSGSDNKNCYNPTNNQDQRTGHSSLSTATEPNAQYATRLSESSIVAPPWTETEKRKQTEQESEARHRQAERERQRDELDAKTDQLINEMGQKVSHLRNKVQEINSYFIYLEQEIQDSTSKKLYNLQQKLAEAKKRVDRL